MRRATKVFCGSPLAYARIRFQHVYPAILRYRGGSCAPGGRKETLPQRSLFSVLLFPQSRHRLPPS